MKLSMFEITWQIADLLPEATLAEVLRRIRVAPELWAELHDAAILPAWLQRPGTQKLDSWQPVHFQLWLYGRANPTAGPDTTIWLQTEPGQAAISSALESVMSASAAETIDLQTKVLAAFAFAQQLASGTCASTLQAALDAPQHWQAVFTCAYAISSTGSVMTEQLGTNGNAQLAALLVEAALSNTAPEMAAQSLQDNLRSTAAPEFCAAIAAVLAKHGHRDLGAALLASTVGAHGQCTTGPAITATRQITKALESSTLHQYGEAAAHGEHMQAAAEAAAHLYRDLALELGQQQVESDPPAAIKHLEAARSLGAPQDTWLAPLAAAHLAIGQQTTCKQLLQMNPSPTVRELIVTARLYLIENERAAALRCATEALDRGADEKCASDIVSLAETARAPELAIRAARRLLELQPHSATTHLVTEALAQIARHSIEPAREAAFMAVSADPTSVDARAAYARSLAETVPGVPPEYDSALDHWQRITQTTPLFLPAQLGFARCALAASKPELALSIAERGFALFTAAAAGAAPDATNLAELKIVIGVAHAAAGNITEGKSQLVTATEMAPALPATWQALAELHASNGEIAPALTVAEHGLKCSQPASGHAYGELWLALARLRVEYGQPQFALEALAAANTHLPFDSRVQHLIGTVQLSCGLDADAAHTLAEAANLDTNEPRICFDLGRAQEQSEPARALASYQRALDLGISESTTNIRIGCLAQRLGQNMLARRALQQAYSDGDAGAETVLALGTALQNDAEWTEARALYQAALHSDPQNSELIARLGNCCLELGQPAAAIAVLAPAAENNLDDAGLQSAIGAAYAATGLWEEALLSFEQALRTAPQDARLLRWGATAAATVQRYPQAIELLRKALQAEPDNAELQALLGRCLEATGEKAAAHTAYLRAADIAPHDAKHLVELGDSWLGTGSQPLALAAYERAALAAPRNPVVLSTLAEAQLNAGNTQTAIESFISAAAACTNDEHAPLHAQCLRRIAESWAALGNTDRALDAWKAAAETFPMDAAIHSALGNSLMAAGQAAASQAAHATAARLERTQPSHLLAAAKAAIAAGDSAASNTFAQQAASLPLEQPEELGTLGHLHHQLGDLQKSLEFHHRACAAAGDNPGSRATLALALADAGEFAEATSTARDLLTLPEIPTGVLLKAASALLRAGDPATAMRAFETLAAGIDADGTLVMQAVSEILANLESAQDECTGLRAMEQPDFAALTAFAQRATNRAQVLGADAWLVHAALGRLQSLSADLNSAIPTLERTLQYRFAPEAACALAVAKIAAGDAAAAAELLGKVLATNANHPRALMLLARCAANTGNRESTASLIIAAASHPAHNALAHSQFALAYLHLDATPECISQLEQALRLAPEHAGWHFHLALQQETIGEHQAALAHYQQAVHLGRQQQLPARRLAAFTARLAAAAQTDGDLSTARREYLNALNLQPGIAAWWVAAGSAALGMQDNTAAAQDFEKAIALEPLAAAAHVGCMQAMLANGEVTAAERHALTAIKIAPSNSEALLALGGLFAARGAHNNALQVLDQALSFNPQSATIQIAKARVLAQAGRPLPALELLKPHLGDACNDASVWAFAGELYAGQELFPESIAAYEHATEIMPLDFAHQLRLGQLCRIGGQPDKAITNLERAQTLATASSQQAAVLTEAGLVFEARRQYDRAFKSFSQAIECAPQQPDNYFRAGLALKGLKDYAEALTMFQKAVTLDPKHREAHRQLATVSALGLMSAMPA